MRSRHVLALSSIVGILGGMPGATPAIAATGRVVAVVIDFGTEAGAPSTLIECVHVKAGESDLQALYDAAAAAKIAPPGLDLYGLLCSIGGIPSSGCGTTTSSGYAYWAYFHGQGGAWHYASDGPAEQDASPSAPEGWRFENDGKGNPSDPPPRTSASPAVLCPATTSVTTPPSTMPSPEGLGSGGATPTSAPVTTSPAKVQPTNPRPPALNPASTGQKHAQPSKSVVALADGSHTTTTRPHAYLAASTSGGGLPVATLAALGIFALLGAGAALGWRRAQR